MHALAIIGQVIFGLYWLSNAGNHFFNAKHMAQYAASKNVPMPMFAVLGAGVLLLIGGLSFVFGVYIWWGILSLVIFLIPVTLTMHRFWTETDQNMRMVQYVNFMKNAALLAALLIMWGMPLAYSLF